MKILTCKQIAEIDRYTIENEPVSDIDLMERASRQVARWLAKNIPGEPTLIIFAGPGNNGGDALAVARMMVPHAFSAEVYLTDFGRTVSESNRINRERLSGPAMKKSGRVKLFQLNEIEQLPTISKDDIIIDGLFGSGLARPLEGFPAAVVRHMNQSGAYVLSIDIPSGLFGEDNSANNPENIVRANQTLTFQFPKLCFFFPENEKFTGSWKVLPIGLHPQAIAQTETPWFFLTKKYIRKKIKHRGTFSHKGTFGHALLISGSEGKMGAAILASKGCLRAGVGLLTTHVPRMGYGVLHTAVPEAMVKTDKEEWIFSSPVETGIFSAVGVGPGLGQHNKTGKALLQLIESSTIPLVLDADALNMLAKNPQWLEKLPAGTILTPHPGEFERLAGKSTDAYSQMNRQLELAGKYNLFIVLKRAYTSIATPGGHIYFNTTGNPGMATAGSGDVLTGVILALLAQGYTPEDAALTGVYLHGKAGDLAKKAYGEEALIASDIIKNLGKAFGKTKGKKSNL